MRIILSELNAYTSNIIQVLFNLNAHQLLILLIWFQYFRWGRFPYLHWCWVHAPSYSSDAKKSILFERSFLLLGEFPIRLYCLQFQTAAWVVPTLGLRLCTYVFEVVNGTRRNRCLDITKNLYSDRIKKSFAVIHSRCILLNCVKQFSNVHYTSLHDKIDCQICHHETDEHLRGQWELGCFKFLHTLLKSLHRCIIIVTKILLEAVLQKMDQLIHTHSQ